MRDHSASTSSIARMKKLVITKQEAAQSAKVSTCYTLWQFGVLLVKIGQLES